MASGWQRFTGKSPYPEVAGNGTDAAFAYGIKANRQFKLPWIQGKRDEALEQEVTQWVEEITGAVKYQAQSFSEWLKDGRILCKLLEQKFPGRLLEKVNSKPTKFSSTDNINNFLNSMRAMGIPECRIFEPNDLNNPRSTNKIIETIAFLKNTI